jgi:endopolyphosphatase
VEEFRRLPNITQEQEYDNYAVVNVSPSIVPNPYIPAFRIYAYNVSGVERKRGEEKEEKKGRREGCGKREYEDTWRCRLLEGWNTDGDGPSRKNGKWTPLGYAQVCED